MLSKSALGIIQGYWKLHH